MTAGQRLTYTVVVTNNGPAAAQDVQVVDALPSGVSYVSASSSQGSCAGSVNCQLGAIPLSGTATITVVGLVDSNVVTGTALVNVARVDAANGDPTAANNQTSFTTTAAAYAALVVTKLATPTTARPGDLVVYQIVVTNTGPSAAQQVTVTDNLPPQLLNPLVNSSQGGCLSFPCSLGSLPAGGSATILVFGTLATNAAGTIVNTVLVSTTTALTNPAAEQRAEAAVEVTRLADLVLVKADDPDPVLAGTTLLYTLTVTNRGPSPAQSVRVTDTLPVGVAFLDGSATCAETGPGTGVVVCAAVANPLPVDSSATFTVRVAVSNAVPTAFSLVNRAVAGSATPDQNPDNNGAVEDTEVLAVSRLTMAKQSAPNPVVAGEVLTYSIVVTNHGPAISTDTRLVDSLPANVTLLSASPSNGGVCNTGVFCLIGNLDVGEVVTVTVVVAVGAQLRQGDVVTNTASAFSDQLSPPLPVGAVNATGITERVDIAVVKQDFPDPAGTGGVVRYGLFVSNAGPSDALNVVVTDTLDSNTTFLQATLGLGCNGVGSKVTCVIPVLRAGESKLIEILAQIDDDLPDNTVITNSVVITSSSVETNTVNNADQVTTTVRSGTDLRVSKSAPTEVIAGTRLTYTIVVKNQGPSDALNVIVTDTLPSELLTATVTFTNAAGVACQLVNAPPNTLVTCAVGTMQIGVTDTVVITIAGDVDPATPNWRAGDQSCGCSDWHVGLQLGQQHLPTGHGGGRHLGLGDHQEWADDGHGRSGPYQLYAGCLQWRPIACPGRVCRGSAARRLDLYQRPKQQGNLCSRHRLLGRRAGSQ